jgi:hypothetical protein
MQLTLTFLEAPPPQPLAADKLDAEARIEAVTILARFVVQVIDMADPVEATNE